MPAWFPVIIGSGSIALFIAIAVWSVTRRHRGINAGPLMLRGPDGIVVSVPPLLTLPSVAKAALRNTVRPAKALRSASPVSVHDASDVLGWPAWFVSFSGRKDSTWSYLVFEYRTACHYGFTAVLSWGFKPARGFRRARFLDGRVRGSWFSWEGWARDWPDTRPEIEVGLGALLRELAGSLRTKCDGIEYNPGQLCIAFAFGAGFKDPDLTDALTTFIEASERLWLLDEETHDVHS